jgi:uncharacterized membrane protein YdjX (TVP38/TMEM64 family)
MTQKNSENSRSSAAVKTIQAPPPDSAVKGYSLWRVVPVVVVLLGAAFFFVMGWDQYLSFNALRDNRETLLSWVDEKGSFAAVSFVFIYAAGIVFIPPSGALMTLAAGFVFGAVSGAFYVVVGATVGATILFLLTKLFVGDFLHDHAGTALRRMEKGFQENEISYMLVLRLVPLFPFWLVNMAPALLGVRLRNFVIGTFFGIIPGTFVYAIVGAGLGSVFDANEEFSLVGIMTPETIVGLIGLAVLSLIPVVYKKIKVRRKS